MHFKEKRNQCDTCHTKVSMYFFLKPIKCFGYLYYRPILTKMLVIMDNNREWRQES